MAVSLCSNTVAHFRHLVRSTRHKSILLGVESGCNGLKYLVQPTSETAAKLDKELTVDGVHIIVCGKSLLHLLGTSIRWEEDAMGAGLRFDNPNATCGETFS